MTVVIVVVAMSGLLMGVVVARSIVMGVGSRMMGGMVIVTVRLMAVIVVPVSVGLGHRMSGVIVVPVPGRGVIVIPLSVVPVAMGVRFGMGGVIVVPMRVMRGGGVVIMTRVAMVVVRLVLFAHLGWSPAAVPRSLRRNRYNVIKQSARLRSPRTPGRTDARR